MGVKYTHEFISDKGNVYIVDIHDSLFSGSETEVRALAGGFRIRFNSESDDINEPVKASSCTFNMLVEDSTMQTYIESLVDRPYGDIHLVITKNADTYWAGTVNTRLIKLEHASYPYAIEFNAVDGLGELQNYKFDSDNMTILSEGSRYKLTQFFADILNKAGVTSYLGTSNLFSTASPLYETQTVAANDVFATSYLYTSAFTDQNGNYNLNYSQVLRQLLIGFNSRIMLANGKFRIIDNRFYDYYTVFNEFTYSSTGVQQSAVTFNNSVAYGTDRIFLADPVIEFDPGLKIVEAKQITNFDIRTDPNQSLSLAFGSSGSSLFTVRRQPILGADASSYGYSSLIGGSNKRLRLEFVVNNNGIDPKKIRYINVIIQVTNGVNSKRLSNTYNSFTTINPTTKNIDPYAWVTPSLTEGVNILFSQGKNGKYVIDLPDLPYANCEIEYLTFMLMGDYDVIRAGTLVNSSYDIFNLNCSNIVTGMIVTDLDLPGNIQLVPPVTINTINAARQYATMSAMYVNLRTYNSLGFILPANDIVSGDESLISIEISSFSYLPEGVNTDNEGYVYSSINDDVFTEKYLIDPVYFGDGFNIQNKNTLYVNTGFGIVPSSEWTIKPSLEVQNSGALLQKLTQAVLWHQYKGLKRYNGTIFTIGYEPYQVITKSGTKLVFIGGEFVAGMDEWSGSWAVWQYRPDAYVSNTKGTGIKASNVNITKDIYPKVNISILDNDIKLIADIIGSMGGALAMFRQGLLDAEEKTFNYIGIDPQFTFQTTGSTAVVTDAKDTDIIVTNENGKFWKVVEGVAQEQFKVNMVTNVPANKVYAGPTTGVDADPTFRSLVITDLPSGLITGVGTINSISPKVADGAQISGASLIMQTADSSYPGLVSIGTQTFGGAKTFTNAAKNSIVINGTWTTSADGDTHVSIAPNITANVSNRIIYAMNLNPTMSNGGFTGVSLIDLNFGRNNPVVNFTSGDLTIKHAQISQVVIRSSSGGVMAYKLKLGNISSSVTNTLDVGGDSLFGPQASTPATAGAKVHIVGVSGASALLVKSDGGTTILEIKNNQDIQLGSSGGKIGLFAVAAIARPTTSIAAATFAANTSGIVDDTATFDGYTIGQIVKALRNLGALT